ncbi:MAG: aminotransferase class I/II-fold pyridoxal phosphate-dependent enzyme [Opitutales bacterium]|nr:aminotransferase class I/II-fold pyridoxal phosphate-dependent enzyme [Opitutales bacterium]
MITDRDSPSFPHAGHSGSNPEQRPGMDGRGAFHEDAYPLGRPVHGGQCHPGILDFSVNLNPLAPPIPDATWMRWKNNAMRYPPATSDAISVRLAGMLGSDARQTVVTNGGMEALQVGIAMQPAREVCIPAPCFAEYPYLAQQANTRFRVFIINPTDWWNPDAWLEQDYSPGSLVVLANPANPTGMRIPRKRMVQAVLHHRPHGIRWLVDEAFMGFSPGGFSESLLRDIHELPEVTVAGSLTKLWSIPGLRLGYLVAGNPAFADAVRQRQLSWPLNGIATAWADEFLHSDGLNQLMSQMPIIHEWRDDFQTELHNLPGIRPMPSNTNFFLADLDSSLDRSALSFSMKQKGIAVRSCESIPGMENAAFWRIAVRAPEENNRFIVALEQSLNTLSPQPSGKTGNGYLES